MKSIIVLVMHGAPPNDFPRQEMGEFFTLHGGMEHAAGDQRQAMARRYDELHAKMRAWPRTPENDPFHAASIEMGEHLGQAANREVIVSFNEFCAPPLDEALDQAAASGAGLVIVVTPMMTRGGEHAEVDIPAAIERARERHPGVAFRYAWPFDMADVARFLTAQVEKQSEA
jgi:sirohydrochlorin cobaltochelatase